MKWEVMRSRFEFLLIAIRIVAGYSSQQTLLDCLVNNKV